MLMLETLYLSVCSCLKIKAHVNRKRLWVVQLNRRPDLDWVVSAISRNDGLVIAFSGDRCALIYTVTGRVTGRDFSYWPWLPGRIVYGVTAQLFCGA